MGKKDFAERLDAIKKTFGIKNDSELSRRLDCSQSYLSRVKSGKQPLVDKLIGNFLKTFPGLSEDFIREGTGDPIDPSRQADLARETLIDVILRCYDKLDPEIQEILLESARRISEKNKKIS